MTDEYDGRRQRINRNSKKTSKNVRKISFHLTRDERVRKDEPSRAGDNLLNHILNERVRRIVAFC
jgi:hypothetical protein